MATKPYYTSDDLIESVKRKIAFPIAQNTFDEEDILAFANEEMYISQVPSVMQFHEEFFTRELIVPLEDGKRRYPIPERAIGNKLRDLFYVDSGGNEYEMSQILQDDRAHFSDSYTSGNVHKFYFQGNEVVLVTSNDSILTGALKFVYYLRPNSLVRNSRAAICQAFSKTITVDNSSVIAGDYVSIGGVQFIAGTDFVIGASSVETATNLTVAINTNGVASANNGTISTSVVTVQYSGRKTSISSSKSSAFSVQSTIGIVFDQIPSNITQGSPIDFLRTRGGHRSYDLSVQVPTGSISGTTISFSEDVVDKEFVVGDYICSEYECIIPQIPDDLHTALSERTCGRILSAMGDSNGYKMTNEKINEIEARQGTLIDNRGEGTPQKVTNTHSLIRYGKRRRFTRR